MEFIKWCNQIIYCSLTNFVKYINVMCLSVMNGSSFTLFILSSFAQTLTLLT